MRTIVDMNDEMECHISAVHRTIKTLFSEKTKIHQMTVAQDYTALTNALEIGNVLNYMQVKERPIVNEFVVLIRYLELFFHFCL